MHRRFSLLGRLSCGEPVAGSTLAAALGVSRGAVWQQIENLRRDGVEILADATGYRLAAPFIPYDTSTLLAALTPPAATAVSGVSIADVTASTNDDLIAELDAGRPIHGMLKIAEFQSRGRGRRGDAWLAAPGGSVAMSFGWHFDPAPRELPAAGLVVGIAAAEAVREVTGIDVEVKWPNDLTVAGAKLAGVLVDMRGEVQGPCALVIGIGLNVAVGETLRAGVGRPLTDLRSEGVGGVDRNLLVAAIVNHLVPALFSFGADGFEAFAERYRRLDALEGRRVRITPMPDSGEAVNGIAAGIALSGALKVMTPTGERSVFSGHVAATE